MLLIQVQIRPSYIDKGGLGIFTLDFIPKGTTIWTYRNPPDWREDVETWNFDDPDPKWENFRKRYAYKPSGKNYFEFPGDAALFINHSFNPNLTGEDPMIACRDIKKGEEITANYLEFDQDPYSGGKLH